jgi:hypothetical protein
MDKFYCETQLSERISKTPEGFLVCHDVPITVAGDMYYTPDQFGDGIKAKNGHVRVAKNIDEIHSDATIRSFEGKPITLGHPKDDMGNGVFVTPENAMDLARGVIQNVRPGSGRSFDKLLADFVIMDKEAIDWVESGDLREVSCGYNYDAANIQDGFFEQTNIRGNHVALVPRGRAGPQCAIFDSKEDIKDMSLKDKLKEAVNLFSKAIDEAVPDEMATKVESAKEDVKAVAEKAKAADESPMVQAMEDMAFMSLDARICNIETMLSELTAKIKDIVFDKVVEKIESVAEDAAESIAVVAEEPAVAYDSDTISKAEVLAPGLSKTEKDIKRRALDSCYKTESGKKIIDRILQGKSFDAIDNDILFNAAAALLSAERASVMKQTSAFDAAAKAPNYTNVSVLNKANEDYWSNKQIGVLH